MYNWEFYDDWDECLWMFCECSVFAMIVVSSFDLIKNRMGNIY